MFSIKIHKLDQWNFKCEISKLFKLVSVCWHHTRCWQFSVNQLSINKPYSVLHVFAAGAGGDVQTKSEERTEKRLREIALKWLEASTGHRTLCRSDISQSFTTWLLQSVEKNVNSCESRLSKSDHFGSLILKQNSKKDHKKIKIIRNQTPPAPETETKPTLCLHPDDRAQSLTRLWLADIIAFCQGAAQTCHVNTVCFMGRIGPYFRHNPRF